MKNEMNACTFQNLSEKQGCRGRIPAGGGGELTFCGQEGHSTSIEVLGQQ